ncbi:MAG: hypothetical protein OXU98_06235, partial [Gammaproteobacteria bacterium]|nr:hypothetical protein [Gammaproteobacteria bacterium]
MTAFGRAGVTAGAVVARVAVEYAQRFKQLSAIIRRLNNASINFQSHAGNLDSHHPRRGVFAEHSL